MAGSWKPPETPAANSVLLVQKLPVPSSSQLLAARISFSLAASAEIVESCAENGWYRYLAELRHTRLVPRHFWRVMMLQHGPLRFGTPTRPNAGTSFGWILRALN